MNNSRHVTGKRIGESRYLHTSALHELDADAQELVLKAAHLAGLDLGRSFNVVKLRAHAREITLLNYATFFEEAFPSLQESWTFDSDVTKCRYRVYLASANPPILHRKELLLATDHPDVQRFSTLTKEAENIGLFDETSRIGFFQGWERLLQLKGYELVDHSLVPIANEVPNAQLVATEENTQEIHRHLTALTRTQMSAPMQSLARYDYLNGSKSVFDYGCGKGRDVELLRENGVSAEGWDPYYAPNAEKKPAQIVNLGFVINVIESPEERGQALAAAFELASECLVVSAMLANANARGGMPFRDGVRTSRNTFQKYFSQAELAAYIENILETVPTPIAPGIFYAFKTSGAEADFFNRKNSRRRSSPKIFPRRKTNYPGTRIPESSSFKSKYENNAELLETLWSFWLELGREPKPNEVVELETVRDCLGSYPAALKTLLKYKGKEGEMTLETAHQERNNDLIVQMAENRLYRKPLPRPMTERLKEDIRHFFGNQANALSIGEKHLIDVLDKPRVHSACVESSQKGIGWLDSSHSLQLHTDLIPRLPPVLRLYIICASSLYGDPSSADLVKIHIRSGKLTLMNFDNFWGKAVPRMLERTKINLMNRRIDVFQYGDAFEPPNLYLKSRYLNEDQDSYSEQLQFDELLEERQLTDFEEFGPSPAEFENMLRNNRLLIDGTLLKRSQDIPLLDSSCGRYLKYKDLIECGPNHLS